MTTTNTFGIVFYLKRQKQKKGKAPIYARITVDGQRVEISIKKDIDVENWSKGKGMAKGKGEEIKGLNTFLEQIRSRMAIIEKYKNNPRVLETGRLLPVYANQILNNYLKEIADFCGIEKPLSFHIARHTFATTVTLTNGVPMETVSKMLGHTSIKTTQIYAKVIEQKVSKDMSNLKEILQSKQRPNKNNETKIC